jgi:hypothetical protein
MMLLCSRQAGKSTAAAGLALKTALAEPPALVLLCSPSLRQSGELFRKVTTLHRALSEPAGRGRLRLRWGSPVPFLKALGEDGGDVLGPGGQPVRQTALQLELANGSRVVSLPGTPDTLVGFSGVRLLIIDEAARVPDELYFSARPMLARSRGRLLLLSTPKGKRGFFYEEWQKTQEARAAGKPGPWEEVRVTAADCAWLDSAFLAAEEASIGPYWFRQEYLCSFEENVGALFREADIEAMFCDRPPLFEGA